MADTKATQVVEKTIRAIDRWADAIDARVLRKIRRSQLHDIKQETLSELAAYRFEAPHSADFRMLMSNVALVASRESSDSMLEQWLRSFSGFLQIQLRSRDPFHWRGESKSQLYGLDMALPKKNWPYAFGDR